MARDRQRGILLTFLPVTTVEHGAFLHAASLDLASSIAFLGPRVLMRQQVYRRSCQRPKSDRCRAE